MATKGFDSIIQKIDDVLSEDDDTSATESAGAKDLTSTVSTNLGYNVYVRDPDTHAEL